MKRFLPAILVVAAVVGWAPPATALTIKLATLAPKDSPWYDVIRDMTERWQQASGGRIRVRIYPGGVAGDDPDIVRKMRIGQLQAGVITGQGLTRIADEVQALQMPMMFRSDEELAYVRERIEPRLNAILEERGFKVLAWGDPGWVHFFTQRPVVHPDDLKPLKLFAWAGDEAHIEAWKAAGYQPVPLAATEIHTALQSGLINAVPLTPIGALYTQWFGLAKHMTNLRWVRLVGAFVISNRAWRAIPDDVKPALLEAADDARVRMERLVRKFSVEAVDVMKKYGLVVHDVPPEVADEWERRARAAYPAIVGRIVPAYMVAEVERFRAEFRALPKGQ